MKKTVLSVAVGCLLLSGAALAHHGDAGRYIEEVVTLNGVVVETQLVNPHAIVVFDVADATGKNVRWQAELGGAQGLVRSGWTADVKTGTKITLTGRRLKSGAPYMNLTERARVVLTDGGKEVHKTANFGEAASGPSGSTAGAPPVPAAPAAPRGY